MTDVQQINERNRLRNAPRGSLYSSLHLLWGVSMHALRDARRDEVAWLRFMRRGGRRRPGGKLVPLRRKP